MSPSDSKPIAAYLGPIASYSQQAALQAFAEDVWYLKPVTTIDDVCDATQDKHAVLGVVPIENSTNGSVVFTLDDLADRDGRYKDIYVNGEIYVDVHHQLLGHKNANAPGPSGHSASGTSTPTAADPTPSKPKSKPLESLDHIKKLYSHPQAFGQCTKFISTYLKNAEKFDVSSTSKAAELVAADTSGTSAAISSKLAGELYKLDTLAASIEDRDDNTTRFLIIGTLPALPVDYPLKQDPAQRTGTKSLVTFTVPHKCPGALADILGCFREFQLDLTSINSRPSLLGPFQYIIFVEFEGHKLDDPDGRVNSALIKIEKMAQKLRWLGSWYTYR
ncbi:chorismate mutase/prephenate dehydratase [Akanthomyces lecanii RCEF 1005]|uniref:prephenate dehydratase n=2 Tax=Akanthomyces TaxID=150366 RepID=A0A168GDW5_CORDF|nr:chorismate mutase/prephenate dehydratase [Akanthomyces lecanii RCEF 1005]